MGVEAPPRVLVQFTWAELAACRDRGFESFFPEQGHSSGRAKAICRCCVVRATCLEYALEHNERGIWGGTTERERSRIRAVHRRVA